MGQQDAVDAAKEQVRKQAAEPEKRAVEAERAAKRQRLANPTSTASTSLPARLPQYSITFSGKVAYLAPEYEAAIKAVKKIAT